MKKYFLAVLTWLLCITPGFSITPSPNYYTVVWKEGKAWFLDPAGKPFLSLGVNAIVDQSYRAPNDVYYNPVKNQYGGNKETWVKKSLDRLKQWHFNTIGSWSDDDLIGKKFPYTYMLYIAWGNPWESVLDSVFTPDFETRVRENAQKALPFKNDPSLIGYFLDNELPWWGQFGWNDSSQKTLLEKYAAKGLDDPNRAALKKFFVSRYSDDVDAFNQVWDAHLRSFDDFDQPVTLVVRTKKEKADADAWAGVVAERYFAVTTKALREVDPHHLILGVRFAGQTPWDVVAACGKYCDVVSVNQYQKSGEANRDLLDRFYAKTQKPILLGEYSYSAKENQSGDPNTSGADVVVPTQKERVEHLKKFTEGLLQLPYIVGFHWFEWADESPQGRFDGENCDYGLVDIHDKEYALLTQAHTHINSTAAQLHTKASSPLPAEFKEEAGVDYRKAEPSQKVPEVRNYLEISPSVNVPTWGDGANGGKVIVDPSSGSLALQFASGTGWGCGIRCPSNIGPFSAAHPGVIDARGYHFFQFKAFIPKDLKLQVFLTESGVADPSAAEFKGVEGADGESYSFPSYKGSGKWTTYRIDLADLEHRTVWGNQHGNHLLDLQGLGAVEFFIPGNQGAGKVLLKDLEFRTK